MTFASDEWLVWNDHSGQGVVGRLPADGGDIADTLATPDKRGILARFAVTEVMDAVWRTVAR
jgi:hypothetical protein